MPDLRETAKRSKSLTVAAMVARDVRTGLQSRFGRDLTTNGATHVGMSIDESLAYIDAVYEDFLEYGRLSAEDLRGARILEIGPGDNFGLGLRLLAGGAREVVCADR